MSLNITFIGLGVMGFPMAGHLTQTDHQICAFNRSANKRTDWLKQYTGKQANSYQEAVEGADVVITCIGKDQDLLNLFIEQEGILKHMKPGALIIDHTTASATVARQLYAVAKERQIDFVDAPVSGGQQGAENGQLTIMLGGDKEPVDRAIDIIKPYSKAATHMGDSGSGQLTKMVNQITITGLLQSLSEALLFAEKAGLDQQKVIDVISKGAAQSWQMENRHKTMIQGEYNHGFAVDLMRKDLAICLNEASEMGVSLPIAALIDQYYAEVQSMGGQRWDTSSLLARMKKLNAK